jgi:hypothetical protein
MLLPEVYTGPAIIDTRAVKRDKTPPVTISVRAMGTGSVSEHIDLAVSSSPIPCAYITATGQVWILTGGGSGVIAFAGDDPTIDQGDKISLLVEALEIMGGEVEALDEPEPAKPKRKNRKADPITEDVPAEVTPVTSWEAWTVNDEGDPF